MIKNILTAVKNSLRYKRRIKTTTMLQMEATECGAASLRIILDYYRIYRPLEELRELCGVSRDGSNAAGIVKAAKIFNLKGSAVNIDIPQVNKSVVFPAILFWGFNHFLVLEHYDEKKQRFYVNDPASGRRIIGFEEFDQNFTGVVINFAKEKEFKPIGKKPKSFSRLLPILKNSKFSVAFIMLATLLLIIPGLGIPVFTKIFIDDVLIHSVKSIMPLLLVAMILMFFVQAILTLLQQVTLVLLGVKLSIVNSMSFMNHVFRLPIIFFSQRYLGDIADRINLNEKIALTLSNNISINVINLLTSVIYGIVMLLYDVTLGLVVIGIMFINVIVLKALIERQNNANQVMFKEKAGLLGVSSNGLRIIDTLKSNGMEMAFFRKWSGYQAKMLNAKQSLHVYSYILSLTPTFLSSLALVLVFYVGSFKVLDGIMTVGTLIAFQSLMYSFISPISNLVGFATELQILRGDIDRTNDVFNYKTDPLIQLSSDDKDYQSLSGKLQIKDLSFSYSKFSKPIFEDFNLDIEPGTMVAIVGSSGSGKSTLIKLLTRLYYPDGGYIYADDIDLKAINRFLFSSSISVVSQEIVLFPGSIYNNLTLWDHSISKTNVYNALKDACILDMVSELPQGYHFQLEENGMNFSGGQRQCLEIARALVTNPPILIFDEATSALDSIIESEIIINLKQRGCTCVFVAHRLSAIRDAHKIIVLDQGKVAQVGTHNELIKEDNIYKTLISQ